MHLQCSLLCVVLAGTKELFMQHGDAQAVRKGVAQTAPFLLAWAPDFLSCLSPGLVFACRPQSACTPQARAPQQRA